MGIGTAIAALGTAAIGANAAKKAASSQNKATQAAMDEQARQYDLTREDQAPYREAGYETLKRLLSFQDPSMNPQDVMNEPGYQFGLQEGLNNVQNTAAARGGLYSGSALKGLTRYANDYASTKYGDAWNRMQADAGNRWGRMASLAGIGQTATQQSSAAGQNYANAMGGLMTNNANAQGAAGMMRGNILGSAMGQLGSLADRSGWFGGGSYGQQNMWAPGYDDVNGVTGGWTGMR